jgi:hypothetical protein
VSKIQWIAVLMEIQWLRYWCISYGAGTRGSRSKHQHKRNSRLHSIGNSAEYGLTASCQQPVLALGSHMLINDWTSTPIWDIHWDFTKKKKAWKQHTRGCRLKIAPYHRMYIENYQPTLCSNNAWIFYLQCRVFHSTHPDDSWHPPYHRVDMAVTDKYKFMQRPGFGI